MSRTSSHSRGFTLLEVMIASAMGVAVLSVGLVAGMQMQKRALFEEQTMLAQVTGRAVKDMLTTDLQRAGLGMGNAPVAMGGNNQRFAIQSWTEPDLSANVGTDFLADSTFALPPAGTPYANLKSDVLRMYWGDTRSMIVMAPCGAEGDPIRQGNSSTFCTAPNPPTDLQPPSGGPDTQAILMNPATEVACHIEIQNVNSSSMIINANPGAGGNGTNHTQCGARDGIWKQKGWMTMATHGVAYRVNWRGGSPVLEYQAPGTTAWTAVSQDVERLKIRAAVINLSRPNDAYRWFPDASRNRPAIDQCVKTHNECSVDGVRGAGDLDDTDEDRRNLLRRRVREVEVILTIRTKRADRDTFDPNVPVTEVDAEGFPKDGFKRRTFTFRVTPRNFVTAGQQIPTDTGT
jgi:type IV pilus assembly protein PilW